MHYVVEDTPLGTAGAVKMAAEVCWPAKRSSIISGDALTDIDLTALIEHHRTRTATTSRSRCSASRTRWSSASSSPTRPARITRFLEKPSWGEVFSDTINTGIYVIEPDDPRSHDPRPRLRFLQGSLSRHAARRLRSSAATSSTRTGPTSATSNSTSRPTTTRSRARCGSNRSAAEIAPGVLAGADCRIDPDRRDCTGRSFSGEGVRIGAGVEIVGPATLGDGAIVEAGARITAQRAVGRLLHRRRGAVQRLHDRRPQHDRTPRHDQRVGGDRPRLHDRCRRGRQRQPQAVARQVGHVGLDRLDVADLRSEMARLAVRVGRHQRPREPRDHARVRAQARPGVRFVFSSPANPS